MPDPIRPQPEFLAVSDHSVLVQFDTIISVPAHEAVVHLLHLLDTHPLHGISDLSPAYASLLVRYDPLTLSPGVLQEHLQHLLRISRDTALPPHTAVEIPVCYGGDFGPDLAPSASLSGLSPSRFSELHAATPYHVFFLGFSPGFAYLGELPEALHVPRLPSPRREVPAGSVAIAGPQTGIYPCASPGGWRIIGRTPLRMFDPLRQPMTLLETGATVRFRAISPEEFIRLHEAQP